MNALVATETQALEALPPPRRETILAFQDYLSQFDQVECPLKHIFAPGVYLREIFLPAGIFVIGKIHKHAHGNIVSRGRVTVVTEHGRREIDTTSGPVTFVSEAGTKRALYVHQDTIWTTIHTTLSTDLAEIEREIIAPTYAELDEFMARELEQLIASNDAGRVSLRPGLRLQSELAAP